MAPERAQTVAVHIEARENGTLVQSLRIVKHFWLEVALLLCGLHLAWIMYAAATSLEPGELPSLRNKDFPNTYISSIHLDVTSPSSYVRLTWTGPQSARH